MGVRALRNESNCAATGAGNLVFKKPSVTCTAFCAFSSLIPVFWTITLINSFIMRRRSVSQRARARNILSRLDRFLHWARQMELCVMRLTMDSKSMENPTRVGTATILLSIFGTRCEFPAQSRCNALTIHLSRRTLNERGMLRRLRSEMLNV